MAALGLRTYDQTTAWSSNYATQIINREGVTTKKKMTRTKASKYFASDGSCHEHGDYDCGDCIAKVNKSIALIPVNGVMSGNDCDKAKAIENFDRQINFIRTVEGLDEEALNKIKVKDLPAALQKAQENVTVGHMKKLLSGDRPGVVGRFLQGVACRLP